MVSGGRHIQQTHLHTGQTFHNFLVCKRKRKKSCINLSNKIDNYGTYK